VKLYGLRLSDIPPGGFPYTRSYRNKQTLRLNFAHGPSGQLDVSVVYTPAPNDGDSPAAAGTHGLLPLVVMAALAAYRQASGIWHEVAGFMGVKWGPSLAVATIVMTAGLSTVLFRSYWAGAPPRQETSRTQASAPSADASHLVPEASGLNVGQADENSAPIDSRLFPDGTPTVTPWGDNRSRVRLNFNVPVRRVLSDDASSGWPASPPA
jgi:hypothetical protein